MRNCEAWFSCPNRGHFPKRCDGCMRPLLRLRKNARTLSDRVNREIHPFNDVTEEFDRPVEGVLNIDFRNPLVLATSNIIFATILACESQ